MNNEPVAWMIQYKDRHKFVFEKPTYSEHILACEPLYTHPAELTDEEILEYADAFGMDMGTTYEFGHGRFIAVVRAILKKARNNG